MFDITSSFGKKIETLISSQRMRFHIMFTLSRLLLNMRSRGTQRTMSKVKWWKRVVLLWFGNWKSCMLRWLLLKKRAHAPAPTSNPNPGMQLDAFKMKSHFCPPYTCRWNTHVYPAYLMSCERLLVYKLLACCQNLWER